MKIGLLTSSRADFGIYLPLIKEIVTYSFFNLEIIVFGTHLSEKYGYTIKEIERENLEVKHKLQTLPKGDSPLDISKTIGKTIEKFSDFWDKNKFDLVFALGDRFEMFAAVAATSPYNIDIAHIHAGETTLGAIDNSYRHSISLMSKYLFVTTEAYKKRGIEVIQKSENVFNVGALSIDNLKNMQFYSKEDFNKIFEIDLNIPYILTTFHPETVSFDKNEDYINELINALESLNSGYNIIITMPNSDTMGLMIREKLSLFGKGKSNVKTVESFGVKGYLTCMKYCEFLLGNTSSGFVEASFFPKWVINLGDRQNGRIRTPNIIDCKVKKNKILLAVEQTKKPIDWKKVKIYGEGGTANQIVDKLKQIYNVRK